MWRNSEENEAERYETARKLTRKSDEEMRLVGEIREVARIMLT